MDLREARVGHEGSLFVGLPSRTDIGTHGIGAQKEHIAIATRCQNNGVGTVALHLSGHQVSCNDATGFAFHQDHIHHFMAVVHLDLALGNLTA